MGPCYGPLLNYGGVCPMGPLFCIWSTMGICKDSRFGLQIEARALPPEGLFSRFTLRVKYPNILV